MAPDAGSGYRTATIRELMRSDGWAPIRRSLGITSFGTNAWTSAEAGGELILEHVEISHEELYLVVQGRASFTVDGEQIDAPAGALVLVPDPAVLRSAVAVEPNTVVLSIGADPGAPFQPSSWETNRDVLPLFAEGRYQDAKALLLGALDEYADQSGLLFNLACAECQLGDADAALDYLRRAVAIRPELAALAAEDSDLAALHRDPRFAALLGRSERPPDGRPVRDESELPAR